MPAASPFQARLRSGQQPALTHDPLTCPYSVVIESLLEDASLEAYWTPTKNLRNAWFEPLDSCRWAAEINVQVALEFLMERVAPK